MTKADIVENVYEKVGGFSKKEACRGSAETKFSYNDQARRSSAGEDQDLRLWELRRTGQERLQGGSQPADGAGDHDQRAATRADVQAQPGAEERAQRLSQVSDHVARSATTAPAVIPDKPFFKIGEAARMCGVKPYVLRYWETESRPINPQKTRTQQRHLTASATSSSCCGFDTCSTTSASRSRARGRACESSGMTSCRRPRRRPPTSAPRCYERSSKAYKI